MLGNAQLSRHDNEINNNNNKILEEAERSFRASLELEEKSSGGKAVPVLIQEQRWWKDRQAANAKTSEIVSSKTASTSKGNQRVSPTKTAATRGRGKKARSITSTSLVALDRSV